MGNHKEVEKEKVERREVVEGQVFEISYYQNSSTDTGTFIQHYDEEYLEKVKSVHIGGGMPGHSSDVYVYFKAKKCGNTKIILLHKDKGLEEIKRKKGKKGKKEKIVHLLKW